MVVVGRASHHVIRERREGRKDDWVEKGSDCSASLRNLSQSDEKSKSLDPLSEGSHAGQ